MEGPLIPSWSKAMFSTAVNTTLISAKRITDLDNRDYLTKIGVNVSEPRHGLALLSINDVSNASLLGPCTVRGP